MAVIGVRISWLMLARKSLFARFPSSAPVTMLRSLAVISLNAVASCPSSSHVSIAIVCSRSPASMRRAPTESARIGRSRREEKSEPVTIATSSDTKAP